MHRGSSSILLVNLFWDTLCVKIWTSFENFPAFSKKRIQHFTPKTGVQCRVLNCTGKLRRKLISNLLMSWSQRAEKTSHLGTSLKSHKKRIEVKYSVFKSSRLKVELKIQISWKLFKFCNRREHGCFAIIGLIGRFCRPWQFSDGRAGTRADENMYVLFLFLILFLDPKKET